LAICVDEYHREYESLFETALAHESAVDPVIFFYEKNQRSKISFDCSFKRAVQRVRVVAGFEAASVFSAVTAIGIIAVPYHCPLTVKSTNQLFRF
jgi:hypothetical protein